MCETEIKRVTTEEWETQLRHAVRKLRKDGFITANEPLNHALVWLFVGLVIRWIWYPEMNILFVLIPAAAGLFAALAYELYFNYHLTKSGVVEKFLNQQVDIGLLELNVPAQFKSYVAVGQSLESDLKILVNNLWWFMYPPKKILWIRWVLTRRTPFWLSCPIFIIKWLTIFIVVQVAYSTWWTPELYELQNTQRSIFVFSLIMFLMVFISLKNSLISGALFRKFKTG